MNFEQIAPYYFKANGIFGLYEIKIIEPHICLCTLIRNGNKYSIKGGVDENKLMNYCLHIENIIEHSIANSNYIDITEILIKYYVVLTRISSID